MKNKEKRGKGIGNGWTVDVIAHIFKGLKNIKNEKQTMELKMNEYQLPENISFNFEELKQELTEKVSMYETLVYTDDQIKEAKADKASLNKLKKALNDERIRREKEYMVPFNDFKSKINEIISIIDKPVAVIDKQVKAYEEKQKQEKLDAITDFYNSTEHPEWLHFSQIMNEKWLNASVSMKSVQESILSGLEKVKADLETLANMPEFGFEATEVYKSSLDINKALAEGQRMAEIARQKAEAEAAKFAKMQEAEGIAAKGHAEAEAKQAVLEAEAAGILAKGQAEAEAMEKKAEAYKKSDFAKLEMMTNLVSVVLPEVASSVAAPMGNIESIKIS